MILDQQITIKTTNKNIQHYKNLGYDIKSGDIINIPPQHLPSACKLKINVLCDICNTKKYISYHSYTRNINNHGYYACSMKCSSQKRKETSLERYGVEHYNKTTESKQRIKKTKLEKYGNENYTNVEKIKKTTLERYGKETYMLTDEFNEKSKKKMMEKYGVKYPLQSSIIQETWKETNIKKYGVKYPLQSENIKEKIKNTKLKNHNDENFNNRDKYKKTIIELYGVDNPMKCGSVKEKLYNTMIKKYGVRHHMHIPEIVEKVFKSGLKIKQYKESDLYYQGTYEKDFLDKYFNIINIERGKSIKYTYNDNEHIYYPDFYITELNLIIEIKSTMWYNKHLEKNLAKRNSCLNNGFSFLFIIDKDYSIFDKIIKYKTYSIKDECYQYTIKNKTINKELSEKKLSMSDFNFSYVDKSDKVMCKRIVDFVKIYEWLGKMPNRPTHRFVAMYNNEIGAVIVLSTPNSFSKLLGDKTKNIEQLISRGASASWTPTNIGSSLISWAIKWTVKNTPYRLFSAYSDPEANELGTIYQACNFTYIGQNYGSNVQFFDLDKSEIGWTTGRNYRKLSYYKKICKNNGITWCDNWSVKYSIKWDNIPNDVKKLLINTSKNTITRCIKRNTKKKHKYIYILGSNKKETKVLKQQFSILNPKLIGLKYPNNRGQ